MMVLLFSGKQDGLQHSVLLPMMMMLMMMIKLAVMSCSGYHQVLEYDKCPKISTILFHTFLV